MGGFAIPFREECSRRAEGCIGRECKRLVGLEAKIAQALRQGLKHNRHLELRQLRAQAIMDAIAKRQMRARVLASDVEAIGVLKDCFIAVAGAEKQQKVRLLRQIDAGNRRLRPDPSPLGDD